ncbi:hypothetical protein EUGRSUZ_B03119 [Eucalyptus grandis]|uniref:Uncharacterized protein n=2 Tax=Eucalyptus grandis TaxID=71139 RepID=A0ACC3LWL2_EUCGR|nr:hypothetical protein EUGRSUZ_B03119 [Eucalyptus grandis]
MWVAPPHPRVRRENPWLGLLHDIAQSYNLVPEFEITLEGINHRPETNNKLATFVTIGISNFLFISFSNCIVQTRSASSLLLMICFSVIQSTSEAYGNDSIESSNMERPAFYSYSNFHMMDTGYVPLTKDGCAFTV